MRASLFIAAAALALSVGTARAADLPAKELAAARKLNLVKCARCHKAYDPADYDKAEWDRWLVKMSKKAKLKPPQQDLLTRYLDSLRSEVNQPQRVAHTE